MTDDQAWTGEELFWTGGEEHYSKMLDDECIMVFPAPAGIIAGPDIAHSLGNAPRWSAVEMTNKHVRRSSPDVLVLAYKAEATRKDADFYAGKSARKLSAEVTEHSDALDLDREVFTKSPTALVETVGRSHRRKSSPYRSAMSMLTFYVNRAGKNLSATRRKKLKAAKDRLREALGREA
jgi:hypothetical protein